jgi:hypothetical protein
MKIAKLVLAVILATVTALPAPVLGQGNPKASATLKVKITFAENESDKKLSNLPYTFYLKSTDATAPPSWTKVRMGSRVPVYVGKDGMQYIDIGTNVDARAVPSDGGGFDIFVKLDRSWVDGEVGIPAEAKASAGKDAIPDNFKQPIIRQFKSELTLTMHDGETIETTQAADPLNGKVLTISVTMNVVK